MLCGLLKEPRGFDLVMPSRYNFEASPFSGVNLYISSFLTPIFYFPDVSNGNTVRVWFVPK